MGALSNGYFLLKPHPAASCHRKGADGAGAQAERPSCWGLLRWQVAGLGLTTSHRSPGRALPSHHRAAGPSRGPRSRALIAHRPGFAKSHPYHLLNLSPHHHHRRSRPLPATAGITVVPDGSASRLAPSFPTEGFSLNQVLPPPQAGETLELAAHPPRLASTHRRLERVTLPGFPPQAFASQSARPLCIAFSMEPVAQGGRKASIDSSSGDDTTDFEVPLSMTRQWPGTCVLVTVELVSNS